MRRKKFEGRKYNPSELKQLTEKTFGEVELMRPLHYELICIAERGKHP